MDWQPLAPQNKLVSSILAYSQKFSYPLTSREIWFWQIGSRNSFSQIKQKLSSFPQFRGYYFLPGQKHLVTLRQNRKRASRSKWLIAATVGQKLSFFPSIRAVFVTGALSMNNSPEDDDIDIMIITSPNTLWPTRFWVSLYLKLRGLRRDPYLTEHSSPRVSNKMCDNLWIDANHLNIFPHDLYRAHEFLQAKCLFDKDHLHHRLLQSNPWIKDYLPIAFSQSLSSLTPPPNKQSPTFFVLSPILYLLNLIFYLVQLLYMLPHLSHEKVGPGFALFHPRLA